MRSAHSVNKTRPKRRGDRGGMPHSDNSGPVIPVRKRAKPASACGTTSVLRPLWRRRFYQRQTKTDRHGDKQEGVGAPRGKRLTSCQLFRLVCEKRCCLADIKARRKAMERERVGEESRRVAVWTFFARALGNDYTGGVDLGIQHLLRTIAI